MLDGHSGEALVHAKVRVLRGDEVMHDGELVSLKHFKQEVKSVRDTHGRQSDRRHQSSERLIYGTGASTRAAETMGYGGSHEGTPIVAESDGCC